MKKFHLALLPTLLALLAPLLSRAEEVQITPLEQASPLAVDPSPPALPISPAVLTQTIGNDDLWVRVRQGFKIQAESTPAIRAQERFYANNPEHMRRVVERSRRYLYFIVSEVEKRGMPMELALLPIVESAFVPKAQSWASASGLWQFIPSTGTRYGLERTWWYDGRQDVMAATHAALDYLQDLYNMFGDWQLALAAYNWGEGGVGRALQKTRAKGLDDDFNTIKKPNETTSYVPKLIAVRNIIADPAAFGISIPSVANKPYFQPVSTGRHIDVKLIAKLAGTTLEEVTMLNPGLIRPVFAHKEDRRLLLPADKVAHFESNLKTYDQPLLSWQPYVTKAGEALSQVAERFNIELAELRDVNKLGNATRGNGQTILVPIRPEVDVGDRQDLASMIAGAASAVVNAAGPNTDTANPRSYRIARGDTLFSVASKHGMTAVQLRAINGIKGNKVKLGQTLLLVASDERNARHSRAATSKKTKLERTRHYTVKRGDTLDEVARRYDVSLSDLKRWNKPATRGALKVGYKLAIRRDS